MMRNGFALSLCSRSAIAVAFVAVAMLVGPVSAAAQQDVSALVERVQRMERTVTDLQRSVYAGQTPPAGSLSGPVDAGAQAALPNLLTKVQQLETQIRNLTGRVEELGYKLDRTDIQLEKVQADTDLRLQALEGGGTPTRSGSAPSSMTLPSASAPSEQTPGAAPRALGQLSPAEIAQAGSAVGAQAPQQALASDGTIQQQYEDAFNMLVKHDYDRAEVAFTGFVKAHPDDALAGNAQYWLGETYYVRQRYQDAAVAFLEGYQRYPKSPKAADNLLKLGMALAQVGQKAEACTTFARLQAEFPDAPTNIRRRLVQETGRLKCAP